jgi:hypothetical protein
MTKPDLVRFVTAQDAVYPQVAEELSNGCKRTHWMWFIFPQIAGLGRSPMAQRCAIRDLSQTVSRWSSSWSTLATGCPHDGLSRRVQMAAEEIARTSARLRRPLEAERPIEIGFGLDRLPAQVHPGA